MTYWRVPWREGLPDGAYERLLDDGLATALAEAQSSGRHVKTRDVADGLLAAHLARAIHDAALLAFGSSKSNSEANVSLARSVLSLLQKGGAALDNAELQLGSKLLEAVWSSRIGMPTNEPSTPLDSLVGTKLIVNRRDENVLASLASEFDSADEIDLLCSFIKRSGVRKILEKVKAFTQAGRRMRVLSTTYLGASEAEALAELVRQGVEVKLSYDEETTRLHAKAWLFRRKSGFHTAYVGSSNLSHAAVTDGLEWNVRLTSVDSPQVIDRFSTIFQSYWDDPSAGFEQFDETRAIRALRSARQRGFGGAGLPEPRAAYELQPFLHQKRILDALTEARALGRQRNLIVAATGTGKTMVAAFDFARLFKSKQVGSLLFVAHRDEILEQSRRAFRDIANVDAELLTGTKKPSQDRFLFATNLTLDARREKGLLAPQAWDYVVIDEVHHAAAATYEELLKFLKPKFLLGLTATPERADGQSILQFFDRPPAADLRIWDAIDDQLLVPFSYFAVDDALIDLRQLQWKRGYGEKELTERILSAKDAWVEQIIRAMRAHLIDDQAMRALAFCVGREHADYVAARLCAHGIPARAITHGNVTPEARAEAIRALRSDAPDRPRVLCVVDVFNEGVDIPEVDTILMLRPTDSATIFLQQLGRGLRKSNGKDSLTVLDFVAHQHERFRIDRRYAAMLGLSRPDLRRAVREGFPQLPSGCVIRLEAKAQKQVLDAIRRSIGSDTKRLIEAVKETPERSLSEFLEDCELEPSELYGERRNWTSLREAAGLSIPPLAEGERDALAELQHLVHVDDERRLKLWARLAEGPSLPLSNEAERRLARMLFAVLYGPSQASDLDALRPTWVAHVSLRQELRELVEILSARSNLLPQAFDIEESVPLVGHARYLTEEIAAAFDLRGPKGLLYRPQVGVVRQAFRDLLLVTIDKSSKSKTPHLQYEDRALSPTQFQWQSQGNTGQAEDDGRRHWDHLSMKVVPHLFVREQGKDDRGLAVAYCWLGPVRHLRHEGERPITVTWQLEGAMPERLYRDLRPAV
jgi:superfamily II DNA or RNA helicase/HKD family nuclease